MHKEQSVKRRAPEWLIGLLVAVVVIGAGLVVARGLGILGDEPRFVESDEQAPSDQGSEPADTDGLTFALWDGTPSSFEEFRGKPLVVNFWASWCPACVAEMPDFQEVHAELGDQVTFLGFDMQENSRAAAEALVEQTGVEYQLALDPEGALYNRFGGIAMPTTVFIDAEGHVVDTHAGTIFAEDLRERIRELYGI